MADPASSSPPLISAAASPEGQKWGQQLNKHVLREYVCGEKSTRSLLKCFSGNKNRFADISDILHRHVWHRNMGRQSLSY